MIFVRINVRQIHVMIILGGGTSYLEPKMKGLCPVFFVLVVQLKWS